MSEAVLSRCAGMDSFSSWLSSRRFFAPWVFIRSQGGMLRSSALPAFSRNATRVYLTPPSPTTLLHTQHQHHTCYGFSVRRSDERLARHSTAPKPPPPLLPLPRHPHRCRCQTREKNNTTKRREEKRRGGTDNRGRGAALGHFPPRKNAPKKHHRKKGRGLWHKKKTR